jgi:hypothetical protein
MLLWDQGFNATPEDRVGALFWRMHRSARIIFSLGFHLGTMTRSRPSITSWTAPSRACQRLAAMRRSFGDVRCLHFYQLAYT